MDAVHDLAAGPKPSRCAREELPGERAETLAHVIGSGDKGRAQLVEGGVARLHRAAALEQEQAQVLAPTTTAGKAQPLAAEQPPRSQTGVDQIALPTPPLLAPRTLTLKDADLGTREEANKPCAVTARTLDREGGQPELLGLGKQAPVARSRRRDLPTVELGTEHVERDRNVDVLVRVDADRHCPLHHLASFSSK